MSNESTQNAAKAPQPTPATSSQDSATAHLLDYWQILYSRKEIVFTVSMLLILAGIIITLKMPQVYAAFSTIEVQRETPNVNVYEQVRARYDPVFLRSQFEIIQSDPVMGKVVEKNNLGEKFAKAYQWRTTSEEDAAKRATALLQDKTTLSIRRDTDIIDIEVRLDKPVGEASVLTAKIADSIAETFMEHTRQINMASVEEGLSALRKQIDDLDRDIAAAEEDLSEFRERNNILVSSSSDTGADILRRQILELSERLRLANINAEQKKGLYELLLNMDASKADDIPKITGDSSLLPLISQRIEIDRNIRALIEGGLGEGNDKLRQQRALRDDIEQKIEERVNSIKFSHKTLWELAETDAKVIERHLADLEREEREVSTGPAIEYERKLKNLDELKRRRTELQRVMDQERVGLHMPKTSVQFVQNAKPSDRPVSPNFALNVVLSVAAGLFFGVLLAFFVEYLDTTVKTVDDIEKYMQSNVIGVIPQKMRALNDPNARSKHSEVYRVLRMNIKSSRALGDGKALVFTSASAGEGKSTTAFNTAWICAEVGEKVLLIDADLHRPRQHKILGVSADPGLSNVVVGESSLDAAIVHTQQRNLDFLPSGEIDSSSIYGLMDTDEMASLLDQLRARYDRIVIDAPPMIGISDTAQLARLGDGVIQIVQHRKYPRALCKRAKDSIVSMGGNFLGVVLNNVNAAHDSSNYYYEHQYYYYYYTRDASGKKHRTRKGSSKQLAQAEAQKEAAAESSAGTKA